MAVLPKEAGEKPCSGDLLGFCQSRQAAAESIARSRGPLQDTHSETQFCFIHKNPYRLRAQGHVPVAWFALLWSSAHNTEFTICKCAVRVSAFILRCSRHHHSSPERLFPSSRSETQYPVNTSSPLPPLLSPWQPPFHFLSL